MLKFLNLGIFISISLFLIIEAVPLSKYQVDDEFKQYREHTGQVSENHVKTKNLEDGILIEPLVIGEFKNRGSYQYEREEPSRTDRITARNRKIGRHTGKGRRHRERGPAGRLRKPKKPSGSEDMPMPTPASTDMPMNEIMGYFEKFHYMGKMVPDPEIAELVNTSMSMAVYEATKMFQRRNSRYGLKETGELDEPTLELMKKPRCGFPDVMSTSDMSMRKKRYVLAGSGVKWENNDLTYQIIDYPQDNDLQWYEVDQEVQRAFKVWEDVTPLRFTKIDYNDRRKKANIEIRFVQPYYDHGDNNPFDGPGRTLAHAFTPYPGSPNRGDTHFDEAEVWTINSGDTGSGHYNLFQVAAHEFGHALGLLHSTDPSALMAPFYPGYIPNFELPLDDIMGIQALYGGPSKPMATTTTTSTTTAPPPEPTRPNKKTTTERPAPTTKPTPSDKDRICSESKFDALTTIRVKDSTHLYKTYGFRGEYYFLIDPTTGGIASGYPRLIREGWPGLPDNIDAALFWDVGEEWFWNPTDWEWQRDPARTFIFKGDKYWEVGDMNVVSGPRHISEWGLPKDVDAAFVWGRNKKTYVFKGDQYYRYTRGEGPDSGYPKPLSVWRFPAEVDSFDAVFQYASGQSYFFKDDQFYGFDDDNVKVANGYPRNSYAYWFRC